MQYPGYKSVSRGYHGSMDANRAAISRLILEAKDHHRFSVREFAKAAGVSPAVIDKAINRHATLSPESCRKLAPWLSVSEDELLALAGHKSTPATAPKPPPMSDLAGMLARRLREIETDYEALPVVGTAAAGRGRGGGPPDEILWTPRKRRRLGGRRFAVEVRGGCMAPLINPGDMAVIDPDVSWRAGQLVALALDEGHQIKRVGAVDEAAITLESLNEPPLRVPLHEADIRGVVIAYWHEFDW